MLRQQINVLRRRAPNRPHLNNTDRFLFVWLYHWFPSVLAAVARPETIIRWHRAGFRAYWLAPRNDGDACGSRRASQIQIINQPTFTRVVLRSRTGVRHWPLGS
jgi:hypothetical protein